jgi:phage terminase large subunit-like protein
MPSDLSVAERLARLEPSDRIQLFADLAESDLDRLVYDWGFWARPKQLPPVGDWFCWLVIAGRGFGKTRMGAEWVRGLVEGPTPLDAPPGAPARIALVADTESDGRDVMIEGESGLRRCALPGFEPVYQASRRRLVWPNGVIGQLYSAAEPDQLRGPQHHAAWGDELAKWSYGAEAWSNLQFGLRLGKTPRAMLTTTPRPIPLLSEILERPDTVVTRGTTFENRSNIARVFFDQVVRAYQGTRLGRQELMGEILEDVPGALWTRHMIECVRTDIAPVLDRIVVAVDPPASSGTASDACGIVVAGRGVDGRAYVLADRTVQGVSPHRWASAALDAYREFDADRLIAEVNNGGDLVEAVIRQIDPTASYRAVHASRGKFARAEPVAALYEQGRVCHVRNGPGLDLLEDQMCAFTLDRLENGSRMSPDRVDALVWALTDLMLRPGQDPRVRRLG